MLKGVFYGKEGGKERKKEQSRENVDSQQVTTKERGRPRKQLLSNPILPTAHALQVLLSEPTPPGAPRGALALSVRHPNQGGAGLLCFLLRRGFSFFLSCARTSLEAITASSSLQTLYSYTGKLKFPY